MATGSVTDLARLDALLADAIAKPWPSTPSPDSESIIFLAPSDAQSLRDKLRELAAENVACQAECDRHFAEKRAAESRLAEQQDLGDLVSGRTRPERRVAQEFYCAATSQCAEQCDSCWWADEHGDRVLADRRKPTER